MESLILLHVKLWNVNQRLEYPVRNNYLQSSVVFHSSPVATSSRECRQRHHVTGLLWEPLSADTREANNYREHVQEYNSVMTFASITTKITIQPINIPYCSRIHSQIYRLVSPLYLNEVSRPGCRQLHVFDSTEIKTKRLEYPSDQGRIAEIMQQLGEMLGQVNLFSESYKQTSWLPSVARVFIYPNLLSDRKRNYV
jgi:hypothetical protein